MKNLVATILVASVLALASCDENSLQPLSVENDLASFASTEDGPEENGERERPKLTEVALENLPTSISDYIVSNYVSFELKKARTDQEGNFHISLASESDRKRLVFNSEGAFIEEMLKPERTGGERPEITDVAIDALPDVITSYITTNYVDGEIVKSGTDPEGNYMIGLKTEAGGKGLLFDSEGQFIEEKTRQKRKKK